MTLPQLRKICATYQALLGLSHWTVDIRWAKKAELPADIAGQTTWTTEHTEAKIVIVRIPDEPEIIHTIIHELLHIRLEGHLLAPRKYDQHYELAINRITDAFLHTVVGPSPSTDLPS